MNKHQTGKNLCWSIALALVVVGCGDGEVDDATVAGYPGDYSAYSSYYPADLAYAVPYYVDDWYDYPYLYSNTQQPLIDASGRTAGSLLRALATGEELCPGQMSIVPKMTKVACGGNDDGESRTGARITFEGCALDNGGQLDGAIEIDGERSFSSDECEPDSVVSATMTGNFENFVFTEPGGERIVIPGLTIAASYTRLLVDRPAALSISSSGSFERYDAAGTLLTQVDLSGNQGVVLGAPPDTYLFKLYGPLTLQDRMANESLTATAVDLTLEPGCCHPLFGSVRVSSISSGDDVLDFGPTCGVALLNEEDVVSLPECP